MALWNTHGRTFSDQEGDIIGFEMNDYTAKVVTDGSNKYPLTIIYKPRKFWIFKIPRKRTFYYDTFAMRARITEELARKLRDRE